MRGGIGRRQVLAAGAAMLAAPLAPGQAGEQAEAGRATFWGPSPGPARKKDLRPGPTAVRLAGFLDVGAVASGSGDIGAAVRKLREQGLTAAFARMEQWEKSSDSMVRELRAATSELDVDIFEVGGYRNILHTDEAQRRENLKYLARCLEVAERIGCRMVGTITGSRNPEGNRWADNYAVHPDNWTLETWKLTVSGIRQVLKDTAGMKAVLGMEAQVTTNLDGPLAHRRLLEDVGDERCKVNLDPTNMVHLHNYFRTTELIEQCFDWLGEEIYGCHAKDSYIEPHTQTLYIREVCPGRGVLDYETYLVRMSRMKWPRALLPEHIPAAQYPEAYAYIRKVAARVGVKIYGEG